MAENEAPEQSVTTTPDAREGGPARGNAAGARPARPARPEPATTCLMRALRATSLADKQRFAEAGLSRPDADDPEIRALLLRQLYTVHLERGDCLAALRLAEEMIDLESLGDVARQDAARAAAGLGRIDVAVGHLRIAARVCPADRRPFHYSTLGALLRFGGQAAEAVDAFRRALRWATSERPLYQAQLALALHHAGLPQEYDLAELRLHLEGSDAQRGYGQWVLGELCGISGDPAHAREYLQEFLERMATAPRAKALALAGEVAHAEALLSQLSA